MFARLHFIETKNANTLFENHFLRVRHKLEHVVLVVELVRELVPVRVRVLLVLPIVPKLILKCSPYLK